jgi:cation diffusion facilitator family transporter
VHARVDGLTSLAVVAGAAGVAAGFAAADPIVGLAIAVVIVGELAVAARDVFRRLLDGVDPALVAAAHQALAHHPGVESVHRVRMRWLGHRLLADVELDVDPDRSLSEAHRIAHDAEHALTHAVPKLAEATVHAYPAHAVKSG